MKNKKGNQNKSKKARDKKYSGAVAQSKKDVEKKSLLPSSKFISSNLPSFGNNNNFQILNPNFGASNYLSRYDELSKKMLVNNNLLTSFQNMDSIRKSFENSLKFSNSELIGILSTQLTLDSKWHSENITKTPLLSAAMEYANLVKRVRLNSGFEKLNVLSGSTLTTSVQKASLISTFTEKSLSNFAWSDVGNKINLNSNFQNRISTTFETLSRNYSSLITSIDENPKNYSGLESIILESSPEEIYSGANLIESISAQEKITVEEEVIKSSIIYENEYTLNLYLPKIHPDLYNMWKGSIETFNTKNSDKFRQFTVSVRELFTHLMQILAPDKEIRKWTNEEKYFHNGNPTRAARLNFICRDINAKPFLKFVEKDIEATLEFIDIFQRGTHSISNPFTDSQLIMIKSKAESTLKFLLEIEFGINRRI